jgi:hypothetical protein
MLVRVSILCMAMVPRKHASLQRACEIRGQQLKPLNGPQRRAENRRTSCATRLQQELLPEARYCHCDASSAAPGMSSGPSSACLYLMASGANRSSASAHTPHTPDINSGGNITLLVGPRPSDRKAENPCLSDNPSRRNRQFCYTYLETEGMRGP